MRIPSWLVLILALTAAWASAVSGASAPRDPYQYFFNETFGDFTEELQLAREQGKEGIFIFFEQSECPFCHRMRQTVLNQPEVQEFYRERFLSFSVDIEGDIEITTFSGETMRMKDWAFKVNRVRATPVMAFYDLEGEQVVKYIGATSGVQEFLWLGEFVAEHRYREVPFIKYKRQKRRQARNSS